MSVKGKSEGIVHGTLKGYRQHIYRKLQACEPCLAALREDNARRSGASRTAPERRFKSDAQAAWYGGQFQNKQSHGKARDIRQSADGPLPAGTTPGRDLVIGDVIVFLGTEHRIDRFEPYTGSLLAELGAGTRIARSGTWGMTIGPDAAIRILPRPESGAR